MPPPCFFCSDPRPSPQCDLSMSQADPEIFVVNKTPTVMQEREERERDGGRVIKRIIPRQYEPPCDFKLRYNRFNKSVSERVCA